MEFFSIFVALYTLPSRILYIRSLIFPFSFPNGDFILNEGIPTQISYLVKGNDKWFKFNDFTLSVMDDFIGSHLPKIKSLRKVHATHFFVND